MSLFTKFPPIEIIQICCGMLYHSSGAVPPTLSEQPFREHKLMITSGVVFLFDDLMYR